jgi:hypothetical protein
MLIHIKHENKRDYMIFIAEVRQIPETNAGEVLRYLLRMNNDREESNGLTLSDKTESNNTAIGYQFPLRFLNIDKFEEFFFNIFGRREPYPKERMRKTVVIAKEHRFQALHIRGLYLNS